MPISLGQLTANRKALTVDLNGDEINLEYYPMRLTADMLVAYASAANLQEMSDEQALTVITSPGDILLHLLAAWDLVESIAEDGTPGPVLSLDAANIDRLGLALQWALVSALMTDAGNQGKATAPAGSAKKRPSGATSSRKVS